MLYWNTVNDVLRESLNTLMKAKLFDDFRLVGGTALSLQLGHRLSVDIDLFTDAEYGSVDFDEIDNYLKNTFPFVSGNFGILPGMGKSYLIGPRSDLNIKLDIYYSNDPFIQPIMEVDGVRMATMEEIIAMKVDVVSRGGRKKDFWDLHETMPGYGISQMLELHKLRHEWVHNAPEILLNFCDFKGADKDFDPNCLRNKYWTFIKEDIVEAVNRYQTQVSKR